MSNTTEEIRTKQNSVKSVRAGHHQKNYVAGVVGRMSADFMADVGELANIDTTSKETLKSVMAVCIDALNEKFKPSVKLNIADYDFLAGKYSRSSPQTEQPATTPQTAQIQTPAPQTATADTTPAQPTTEQLKTSSMEWLKAGKTDADWSTAMINAGVTQENINKALAKAEVTIPAPN